MSFARNEFFGLSVLILSIFVCQVESTSNQKVHVLIPGTSVNCCESSAWVQQLRIYCYNGQPRHILHYLQTVVLKINISSDQYEQYDGSTPEEVQTEYDAHRSSWGFSFFQWKKRDVKLSPFNRSCVGITTYEKYNVQIQLIRIDFWRILMLVCGLAMFLSAPKLSDNPLFYYLSGISVGISASFLIVIYFISKLFPRRPMMYTFIAGGWSVVMYLFQSMWDNMRLIMIEYRTYVTAYVTITGLISFVVCYRWGPVSDPRSKNLIKWALQLVALGLILYCSHFVELSMLIVLVLLGVYNFPRVWVSRIRTQWRKRFPPPVRRLTEDEYYEQGVRETKKALEDLRGYCSSPDCNQWKTVLKLQEPVRFARFMEGSSHLNDQEVLDFESNCIIREDISDDSSSSTSDDNLSD